jgi:hypothetical protein
MRDAARPLLPGGRAHMHMYIMQVEANREMSIGTWNT